jgi:hypothetical protein
MLPIYVVNKDKAPFEYPAESWAAKCDTDPSLNDIHAGLKSHTRDRGKARLVKDEHPKELTISEVLRGRKASTLARIDRVCSPEVAHPRRGTNDPSACYPN